MTTNLSIDTMPAENPSSRPEASSDGPATPPPPEGEAERLVVPSDVVLQNRREIWIEHGSELYRLRITNNGKLLLTK